MKNTSWSFVEENYPNYDSSDIIAEANDLQSILEGDMDRRSNAHKIFIEKYWGNIKNPAIQRDFNALYAEIYDQSIRSFQDKQSIESEKLKEQIIVAGVIGTYCGDENVALNNTAMNHYDSITILAKAFVEKFGVDTNWEKHRDETGNDWEETILAFVNESVNHCVHISENYWRNEKNDKQLTIALLLQLQEYSSNEFVVVNGIDVNIANKLNELGYQKPEQITLNVSINADITIDMKDGETLEDHLKRNADIYLSGVGDSGHENKIDIGGDCTIKVIKRRK